MKRVIMKRHLASNPKEESAPLPKRSVPSDFNYEVNYSPQQIDDRVGIARSKMTVKLKFDFNKEANIWDYKDDVTEVYHKIMEEMKRINPFNGDARYWLIVSDSKNSKFVMGDSSIENFDETELTRNLFKICQSKRSFIYRNFTLEVFLYDVGNGGTGWRRKSDKKVAPKEAKFENLRCVVKIKNNDDSCGYRAIAIGVKYQLEFGRPEESLRKNKEWQKLIANSNSSDSHQKNAAIELIRSVNKWCQVNGVEEVFAYNQRFGSRTKDFKLMNDYLNNLSLSLSSLSKRSTEIRPYLFW